MGVLSLWPVWNNSEIFVADIHEWLQVHILSFNSAENLASDTSSNVQMIPQLAEGEMCYYGCINTLFFWS